MIKTEDIPHLENSTFSTRVVKDIAQNILSFLKSNCTKEGHTYWLFKGENLKALFSGSIMLFGGLVYVIGYISCYCVNPQLVGVTLWSFMTWPLCVRRLKKTNVRIPSLFLWLFYYTSNYVRSYGEVCVGEFYWLTKTLVYCFFLVFNAELPATWCSRQGKTENIIAQSELCS